MKIVLIGAGSYVFAPTVLVDLIEKHRASDTALSLVDVNLEAAQLMAALARRMAQDCAVDIRLEAHADYHAALPGANFVIVCAAVQGAKRWQQDFEILEAAGMAEQARECGGLGGLSYALRSCTMALDICRAMRDACPDAWLLDVTNPMPRVVAAANRFGGVRAVGMCNIAHGGTGGHERAARLVNRRADEVQALSAGLNHFAWLLKLTDQKTGEDLLPQAEAAVRNGQAPQTIHDLPQETATLARWLDDYGAIGLSSVYHMAEYLPPIEGLPPFDQAPFHGDWHERQARSQAFKAAAQGERDWRPLVHSHPSWEHPVDVAIALWNKSRLDFDILNATNEGFLPQLPAEATVEMPVTLENGDIRRLEPLQLPPKLAAICRKVSEVHELVAQGAATASISALDEAISIDPAIPAAQKAAAHSVLRQIIQAHADVLPVALVNQV